MSKEFKPEEGQERRYDYLAKVLIRCYVLNDVDDFDLVKNALDKLDSEFAQEGEQ